jgi:hypothetical protein
MKGNIMELTINTSKKTTASALVLADVIAGRTNEDTPSSVTPEAAFEAADAFFREKGVTDRDSYLKLRDDLKAGLRQTAKEIRAVKADLRHLDGNDADFYSFTGELRRKREHFKEMHDTRRLGKAWSAEARKRTLEAEAKQAVS